MNVTVTGSLTYDRKDAIDRLLASIADSHDITLDVSGVTEIDAYGISVLVGLSEFVPRALRLRMRGVDHLIGLLDAA